MSRFQDLALVAIVVLGLKLSLALITLGAILWLIRRRLRIRRRPPNRELDLARMLLVGLASGLTLSGALELAGSEMEEPTKTAVSDLLRRARASGLSAALAETEGILEGIASHLARAQVTGAPVFEAVTTFVARVEAEERARRLHRAKTLPIRLMIPVSLLLLPGFLLVVMGPTIGDQLSDLTGMLTP